MELRLYDTLTREKREFVPLDRARVRMYVCGPTVYDFAHIGNARPVIVFDVLFRLLRHLYGPEHVTYVRNVTDVDDKINARAAERNISIGELTKETYWNFENDVKVRQPSKDDKDEIGVEFSSRSLGCLEPTFEPRATEHIAEMRTLIEKLVASKHAYIAEGHVLFDVPSMPDYGKLSGRPLDEMIAGARVEVAPYKKDPQDFVLWKPSKPGEPGWPSPAGIKGLGRPGWHIECSAMAWKHLGETFDIHGGGIDLVFPHHENEIAQSRCAFHTNVMANYWMHNGFLQVEGEKMSKSLGNFVTIRELLNGWKGKKWPGQIIRLAMLGTHYRQPIDWTLSALEDAEKVHADWSEFCTNAPIVAPSQTVVDALSDDINTPRAIAELHAIRKTGNASALRSSLSFLGIGLIFNVSVEIKARARMEAHATVVSDSDVKNQLKQIDVLVAQRNAARKAKDFKESDRIRDELAAMGVILKDGKDAKTGEPVTTWDIAR